MTRDEIIRLVFVWAMMLSLAGGVWIYHLRYLRAVARDDAEERARASHDHA